MENLLTNPHRLPLVAPSILSADFARLGEDCADVLGSPTGERSSDDAHADLLHIDVMDGHFVPNLTMGPALVASLRGAMASAFLDVHVMVTDPHQYIDAFAEAGADHLTFHIEPALNRRAGAGKSPVSEGYDPVEVAGMCRDAGMSAGIALNPPTPVESVLGIVHAFDLVLVMSVNPGFSGQAFIGDVLEKTRRIREVLGPAQRLQMDGGIGPETAPGAREAGCDVLVAASAIFREQRGQRGGVIRRLRGESN